MPARQIKHIAISTDNYAHVGRWYQAILGMSVSSANQRPDAAVVVTDGYVGQRTSSRGMSATRPASITSASRCPTPRTSSAACAKRTRT